MSEVVSLQEVAGKRRGEDRLWAVIASVGRNNRVAEVYPNRDAALADRAWREQQVSAHASFLKTCRQPAPRYSVAPVSRAELPKGWRPLPALGFLRGQFI